MKHVSSFSSLGRYAAALLLLAVAPLAVQAQTGSVGIGTSGAPDPSAALEVKSTTKGLLPPRLDKAQRDAIASPAAGLTIYNTTTNKLNTWNGTRWDESLSATEQPTGQTGTYTFAYTGAPQTFTVPAGCFSIRLDAKGAQGGSSDNSGYLQYGAVYGVPYPGGAGARVQATLAVVPGQVLTLYVGGAGSTPAFSSSGGGSGGYNGGGNGSGSQGLYSNPDASGGGGGGASDVRTGSAALADRLLVAAGGGGGGLDGYGQGDGAAGGAGGAPNGGDGKGNSYGQNGATLTSGNALGQGANAYSSFNGAGGGGGYYGGNAGGVGEGGGGGGSSFITATGSSAVAMTAGYNAGNGSIILTLNPTYAAPALDGSNIVNVPGTYDNLGNHIATQNLNLGPNQLVGNGGTTGLSISSTGGATLAGGATIGGNATVVGNSAVGGNSTVNGTAAIGGNVGIGVSGLANRLAVSSTGPAAQLLLRNPNGGTGTTAALDFQTYTPGAATDPSGASIRAIDDNSSAALSFLTKIPGASGNALVERLRIAPAGNVGIGTTAAPTQKLEVAGQIYSSTGGIRFPDNTVQTSAGLATGSAILNQTSLQAGASFNIGGTASVAGQVGIGTTGPAASAALDVSSSTKGFLPPRLTPAQRDAIASPAAGLTIYNTTSGQLNTWNGTSWTEALSATENGQLAGQTFSFNGGTEQLYTVPAGVSSVQVDVRGAQGGNNTYRNPPSGGALGGRVVATLPVTPGEVLRVYVGGTAGNGTTTQQGGANGGGNGAVGTYIGGNPYSTVEGGGGGGASDIRRGGAALSNRVVVAGGGGGAGFYGGGGGGGLTGGDGTAAQPPLYSVPPGTGGTQTAGGTPYGTQGQGGSAVNVGGGGGGGYYGGGAGSYTGGGGGSSYTDPTATGVAHTQGFQGGNGQVIITALRSALLAPTLSGANITNVPGTWSVSGADVYRATGNVGIGTSIPSATLDVQGSSSTVKLGGLAGSSTRMVTAAANGTLATAAIPVDTDAQQLSISGSTISLSNGGNVTVPAQQLSKSGSTINLTNGGSVTDADNQTLSISGSTISLANGGSVTVPSSADNLGNHTATQNLNLGANQLVGNGGSTGLTISSGGAVGIGATTGPATTLDVRTTDNSAAITVGSTGGGVGALYFGNPNHGVKRNYSNGNDVGLYTTSGNLYLSTGGSGSTSEFVLTGGKVGIGTGNSPAAVLHIDGAESASSTALGVLIGGGTTGNPSIELRGSGKTPYLDFAENTNLDYSTRLLSSGGSLNLYYGGAAASKPTYLFNVEGGITANGQVRANGVVLTSDARFKQNVRPLGSALAGVLALRGVRYTWNALGVQHGGTAGAEQVGVLAQEVEKIYPELVSTDKDGYKAVNYAQLTPVLIEAIKELKAEVETLKARAAAAEAKASTTEGDHAALLTMQAQLARLLGETPTAQTTK